MSEHQEIVVILVHGTFAREAEWTDERSALVKFLRENFAEKIQFDRFLWSGHNSYEDRQLAGNKLGDKLDQKITAQPNKHHFVISHSHGGNVALYAARDMQHAEKLNGIACLGTPFLSVTAKDNRPLVKLRVFTYSILPTIVASIASIGVVFLAVVAAFVPVGIFLIPYLPPSVLNNDYVLAILGLAILAIYVAGTMFMFSLIDTYIVRHQIIWTDFGLS